MIDMTLVLDIYYSNDLKVYIQDTDTTLEFQAS